MSTKKLVPLNDWAAQRYSPPPSAGVLRQWRRTSDIYPPPELVGREWYVREDAYRISSHSSGPLVGRLTAA